jgi:hypothetical protein
VVLERVRETGALIHFVRERLPHYGPLVSGDMRRVREEIVKATAGACVAMTAGLLFACFLSMAAIVSAWNGPHRILAARLVCGVWGVVTLIGLMIARKAVSAPPPFHLVSTALARDYAHFIDSTASSARDSGR